MTSTESPALQTPNTGALCNEARETLGAEFTALRDELAQVRSLVGDAIAKLSLGFQGLSEKIKEQDRLIQAMAEGAGSGQGEDSFRAFASETGDVLTRFGERIERTSDNSMATAHQLGQLGERIEEVSRLVGGIKQISSMTRILALNAAIEAAHAGDAGAGFGIVATEVKSLSQRSSEFSDEIEGAVGLARRNITDARSAIEGIVEADARFASQARERVQGMLADVSRMNSILAGQLQEAADASRGIVDFVSLSVTALQFDDMVGQLVEHIGRRLSALEPLATELVDADGGGLEAALQGHWERVSDFAHKAVSQESMSNGDVELF